MSLDPKMNRELRDQKKAAAIPPVPPLNPPFPYRPTAIDFEAYQLAKDPPRIDTAEPT